MFHMISMITISLLFYLTDKMCPCQTYDVRVKLSFSDILSQLVFEYLKYEQKCVCVFQANNYNIITDITIHRCPCNLTFTTTRPHFFVITVTLISNL